MCKYYYERFNKINDPKYIEVWGKFTPRGGISIDPYCNYGKKGSKWEEIALNRWLIMICILKKWIIDNILKRKLNILLNQKYVYIL